MSRNYAPTLVCLMILAVSILSLSLLVYPSIEVTEVTPVETASTVTYASVSTVVGLTTQTSSNCISYGMFFGWDRRTVYVRTYNCPISIASYNTAPCYLYNCNPDVVYVTVYESTYDIVLSYYTASGQITNPSYFTSSRTEFHPPYTYLGSYGSPAIVILLALVITAAVFFLRIRRGMQY